MKERAWTLLEQKDAQLQTLRVRRDHPLPPLRLTFSGHNSVTIWLVHCTNATTEVSML